MAHPKKNKRNKGFFFHKSKGFDCSIAKKEACKDITEESKRCDGIYTRNYISIEYLVLKSCKCYMQIIPINISYL